MKCKSCHEVIPPKLSHSIRTNICAFCGEDIMAEELQAILSNLQDVMKLSEPYKEEVEEWLESNYGLHKEGKHKSTGLLSEVNESFTDEDIQKETEIAKRTAEIHRRSLVRSKTKKSILEEIQGRAGSSDVLEVEEQEQSQDYSDFENDIESGLSPNEMNQIKSVVENSGEDLVKKYYEMDKLKKLHRNAGKQGMINRG